MDHPLFRLLIILSSSIYFALIAGIFTFKKLNKELRIIFYYVLMASILGGYMAYLSINSINNSLYYNIYSILEFIFFAYAIWINQKFNVYKWIGIGGSIVLAILFTISFIEQELIYNNTLRLTEAALLILLSIIYLVRIFGESFMEYAKDPFKYIIIGIFICFSSSALIHSAGNQTQLFNRDQFLILFLINAVFYAIMVLLIIISFIKCYRR